MKSKQFLKLLARAGVEIVAGRGKGGHVLASYRGRQTVIKTHGAADLSNTYVKLVCKQLGIDPEIL